MARSHLHAAAIVSASALVAFPVRGEGESAGAPSSARATAHLVYEASASDAQCPDEAAFRAMVTARLGRDPFERASTTGVEVRVAHARDGLVGTVVLAADGATPTTRDVKAGRGECEAIVEAMASVVAVHLAAAPAPPPLPAPSAPAAPAKARAPEPEPARASEAPAPDPAGEGRASGAALRLAARGAGLVSVAALPGAAAGGEVGVGAERRWFSLFVMGRGEAQLGDASGARGERIEAALLSAGVLPCVSAGWLVGCASAWLGSLQGRAPEAATPSLGSSLVGFVGARAALSLPMGSRLRLTPQVEAWVPLVRTTLVYAGAPTWTAPALSGSFGLGLVYVAPP